MIGCSALRPQRLRFEVLFKMFPCNRRPVVGLGICGEAALPDISTIIFHRTLDDFRQVGIGAHKFRSSAQTHSDKVMEHQNLAVTLRARADSNGRDAKPLSDQSSQFSWNSFQYD